MKNVLKFLIAALVIVAIGAAALYGIQYFRYRSSPEYQAVKEFKELEKRYAEDPYGGDTPEETLQLFIDALKAGDVELASKYFVLDKQGEWKNDLLIIKEKGLLDEMVKDLERRKETEINTTEARYYLVAEDGLTSNLVLVRGPNDKWKIRTL